MACLKNTLASAKKEIVEYDVFKAEKVIRDGGLLIVDVREPEEFSQGHLFGAINVPRGVLEFKTDSSYPGGIPDLYNKSAPILLYCKSGARSALAAQSLGILGYKTVVSMAGGYLAWKDANLPVLID